MISHITWNVHKNGQIDRLESINLNHQMSNYLVISPKTLGFAPNFECVEKWVNKYSYESNHLRHWVFLFFQQRNYLLEKPLDISCPGLRQVPLDCPAWLLVRSGREAFQIKVCFVRINVDSMEILHGKDIALYVGWKFKKRMFLMNSRFVLTWKSLIKNTWLKRVIKADPKIHTVIRLPRSLHLSRFNFNK